MPQKFNLKFNQKLTTRGSEEDHFSYFSNVEEKGPIELGDYFSDDEEDNTWDKEDLTSENFYQWNPVISGLETIHEPEFRRRRRSQTTEPHLWSFRRNATQPFNMATVHSSRACLPKLCCSITAIGLFITGILLTGAYPHQNLDHFNLNQTDITTNGTNLTPTENSTLKGVTTNRIPRSLKTTVAAAQNKALQAILLAHIFRNTDTQAAILHKFISQISTSKSRASRSPRTIEAIQTLETAIARFDQNQPKPEYQFQNTPQATDAGSEPQVYTQLKSPSYSTMKPKGNNRNKNLGDRVAKILQRNTDLSDQIAKEFQTPRRNSRRIQLWPWSQEPYPPTCSLNTAKTVKKNQNKKICLQGEIHSSTSETIQRTTKITPEGPDHQNQVMRPRRKRLLNGSYKNWQHHPSRFNSHAGKGAQHSHKHDPAK
jgi:hypothetical protein